MSPSVPDPVPGRSGPSGPSPWLGRSIVILLVLQLGLLWTHGSMLQRQHDDLQALREDVQDLADSLDQDQDQQDWDTTGAARPARTRPRPGAHRSFGRLVRARQQVPAADPDSGDRAQTQELDAARRSAQDAVVQARDTQQKLSIPEAVRRAEARSALNAAGGAGRWLWALVVALLALAGFRAVLRRRG